MGANPCQNIVLSMKRQSFAHLDEPDNENWWRFTEHDPQPVFVPDPTNSEKCSAQVSIPGGLSPAADWDFFVRHDPSDIYDASDAAFVYEISADTTNPTVSSAQMDKSSYEEGESAKVTWTATDDVGVDHIELYLVDIPGKLEYTIVSNTLNDGEHTFSMPTDHVGTGAKVKVVAFDVAGNSGHVLTGAFTIVDITIDSDGDGVPDVEDAFPNDPNEWEDTDGDGAGNNADTDDDNDGMSDSWEQTYGLDPLDADDASADLDNDGYTNLDEYLGGSNPNDPDSTPAFVLAPNKWKQISLFCKPNAPNNTVSTIFGDDINGEYGTDWGLWGYDTQNNIYYDPNQGLAELGQGEGFWIIHLNAESVSLDVPPDCTVTPTTISSQCPTVKGCFEIPIATVSGSVQWNMLGYPFPHKLAWNKLRIVTDGASSPCIAGCTLAEAQNAGVFHGQGWRYDGDAGKYSILPDSSLLYPWDGFWGAALGTANTLNPKILIPVD